MALPFPPVRTLVRRAHARLRDLLRSLARGHGARWTVPYRRPCQRLCPPYKTVRCVESKKIVPCLAALGQGVARIPLFIPSPQGEGVGAPTRRIARITPGGLSGLLRTMVHLRAPTPCGAPTRHLGLYAFDRGRTGPAPSGRRGCPSTARGRGCVSHRSQVPLPFPAYRTPPEGAPRTWIGMASE